MNETHFGDATLYLGDCLDVLRTLPDASVDSVVTDPPYGLSFMGKRWDYDVPSVEIWAECLRVLKPGGHLLAFAGTRTQHRMAARIEDAGFEIRDMLAWLYGSGFPKSLDVSKAIDAAAGAEREIVDTVKKTPSASSGCNEGWQRPWAEGKTTMDITAPATEAAKQWDGWGTALKPALEPITVARKPLATCATNVLEMVESQLRGRGVRGEILWKPESASGAAKSKKTTSSGSTAPSERSVTSAKTADESVTRSAEQQSLKSSEQLGTSGLNQIRGVSESFQGCTTSDCANPSSLPMEGSAPAAESVSATFSPLTTSTAEEPSTASKFMGRCTPNCAETDSRPDTESFAGIATGLTGSMEIVRINRDSEGFFLWPKGLPEFVPGSPLTVAANVLAHGTGALNIDGCRVGDEIIAQHGRSGDAFGFASAEPAGRSWVGRWPANVLHDDSDEVLAGFPQAGGGFGKRGGRDGATVGDYGMGATMETVGYGDTGSAARFFYCAKASKADRDEGCKKARVTARQGNRPNSPDASGKFPDHDHRPSSGNHHPTVKPTDLMRYLLRLVTPPGGTALDPFMGSGSTGKAALLEHFKFIGIERDPDYLEIAKARIDYIRRSGVQVGLFGEAA